MHGFIFENDPSTTHNQNTQQPNFPFDKLATLIKDFAHCGIMIPLTSVKKNCAISSFVWWQWSNQIVSVIGYICISEKKSRMYTAILEGLLFADLVIDFYLVSD